MKAVQFHEHGDPLTVLKLEEVETPKPKAGHIRVKVHATSLNPVDWGITRGFMGNGFPRGVGLDVSGTVDELGEGVSDVKVGDKVMGSAPFTEYESAGVAEYACLSDYILIPLKLDLLDAAAMPLVTESAYRCLHIMDPTPKSTIFVNGAGTMVGFAFVQITIRSGFTIVASAGPTYAKELEGFGAKVTTYGEGMAERVKGLCNGNPGYVFDVGPSAEILPQLVELAGGDGKKVVTISNAGAESDALGVRNSFAARHFEVWKEYTELAAEGQYKIPISKVFPSSQWSEAVEVAVKREFGGKIMIQWSG